ncbi:hypothetical protein MNBD_NITROSPINAE01-1905 [hydrothermal vent metagenome]|uniref:Peptidase M10 metallopeptidase domain-containing protein n=1 Tax=hydrothermal vent metagenome TaxID=652676 RepID=A0A3B1BZ20_9ZZZZ
MNLIKKLTIIAICATLIHCGGGGGSAPESQNTPASVSDSSKQVNVSGADLCANKYTGAKLSPETIKNLILATNVNDPVYNSLGSNNRLVRWESPIQVYTGGVKRFDEAISNIQNMTNGLVTFQTVDSSPQDGISLLQGSAKDSDGCGSLESDKNLFYGFFDSNEIAGAFYAHIGSSNCDDTVWGNHPSAVAEHEVMHALGLWEHFMPGYDWPDAKDGIMNDYARAVLINIYQNPINVTAEELKICSF